VSKDAGNDNDVNEMTTITTPQPPATTMKESKGDIMNTDGNDSGDELKAEVGKMNGIDPSDKTATK